MAQLVNQNVFVMEQEEFYFSTIKKLQIHSDVKENDRVFYFTTCGWMMWNWLVGALSSGATILLFDGFPCIKKMIYYLKFASEEKATLFGISAKYIDTLNNNKVKSKK